MESFLSLKDSIAGVLLVILRNFKAFWQKPPGDCYLNKYHISIPNSDFFEKKSNTYFVFVYLYNF